MARVTNKLMESALGWASEALGQTVAFHTHNQKGYGVLYVVDPEKPTTVQNEIAGNMWEGISKADAVTICRTIGILVDRGILVRPS